MELTVKQTGDAMVEVGNLCVAVGKHLQGCPDCQTADVGDTESLCSRGKRLTGRMNESIDKYEDLGF